MSVILASHRMVCAEITRRLALVPPGAVRDQMTETLAIYLMVTARMSSATRLADALAMTRGAVSQRIKRIADRRDECARFDAAVCELESWLADPCCEQQIT